MDVIFFPYLPHKIHYHDSADWRSTLNPLPCENLWNLRKNAIRQEYLRDKDSSSDSRITTHLVSLQVTPKFLQSLQELNLFKKARFKKVHARIIWIR